MRNPHGTPIWYELQTRDPDASAAFYDAVIGWTTGTRPDGAVDYRMIDTGAGRVGGVMRLTDEMTAGGARNGWMFYVGVDDVDATADAIGAAGGRVLMDPWTMPGIGRMAICADPQGNAFYIMRGEPDEASTAFDRTGMGKCNWNELATADQAAGNAFYATVFGWTYPGKLAMPGDMGDYVFVDAAGTQIGATMKAAPGDSPGWRFYFRAADIEQAAATVAARGGTVLMGPYEVPGGDRIILAHDPAGAVFGVVGPAQGEKP